MPSSFLPCSRTRTHQDVSVYKMLSDLSSLQQQVLNSVSNLHLLLSTLQVRWGGKRWGEEIWFEMLIEIDKWISVSQHQEWCVWSHLSALLLLSCLSQAVVVQQDSFIEDQRQALSERSSSCTSLSRQTSRPSSLIEQEKQRSLEKQRQELASLQRQQAAHAEEKRRREREWELREQQLTEREGLLHAQVTMHHFLQVLPANFLNSRMVLSCSHSPCTIFYHIQYNVIMCKAFGVSSSDGKLPS